MKRALVLCLLPLLFTLSGCQRGASPPPGRPVEAGAVSGAPSPTPPAAALTGKPSAAGPGSVTAPPSPSAAPTPANGKDGAFALSAPVVRLVNPGREPRRELAYRYSLKPFETGFEVRAGIAMEIGAAPIPPIRVPALALTASVTPKSVSPSGDLRFAFRLGDIRMLPTPDANAQVAALLGQALKDPAAGKFGGTAVISRKGLIRDMTIDTAVADPRLQPVWDQLRNPVGGVVLPDGPVGPGAVWESVQTLTAQGARFRQVTRFTLESRQGDRFRVKTVFLQTLVEPGAAVSSAPGFPPSRINAFDVSLSGVLEWDVSCPFPVSGSAAGKGALRVDLGTGGNPQPMSLAFDLDLRLKPPKTP
ncbi:MAG: hypothetical protein KA419_09445 [Acidobacteria bacterium]|nr:hypothetical protein [Acidobacteriota bacterium]